MTFTAPPRHEDKDPQTPEYNHALYQAWLQLESYSDETRKAAMVLRVRCGRGRCREIVAWVVTTSHGLLWCSAVTRTDVADLGEHRRRLGVDPVRPQLVLLERPRSAKIQLTVGCPHHEQRIVKEKEVVRRARAGVVTRHAQQMKASLHTVE